MAITEDYNYRSLNRNDLMSLNTLNNHDMNIKKFKQLETKRDWTINLYNMDIPGSSPRKYGSLVNKINYVNKLDDIEKTSPRQLHYKLNRPEYNLTNADIDGSIPQCVKFKTYREAMNPLEPKYNLPTFTPEKIEIPKFIRNSMEIKDIEGAQPRKYFKWKTGRPFIMEDIEGTKPKKPKERRANYSSYDYSDVTNFKFITKRCLNPLEPIYELKYGNGEDYIHGKIEGNEPITYPPIIYADPFNLKTTDIIGAQIGSKNKLNRFSSENYNLIIDDIEGSKSGSLRKGITGKRMTNPLEPEYELPGNLEFIGKDYNPYGSTLFAKANKSQKHLDLKVPPEKDILGDNKKIKNFDDNVLDGKKNLYLNRRSLNAMNNPINGKIELNQKIKKNNNIQDNITSVVPDEINRLNNQDFQKEPLNFNPENFKKPNPYHGFIHEKYIIPSDHNPHRQKFESKKHSPINDENKDYRLKQSKIPYASIDNPLASSYKQTFAQKLDKFIGSV